MRQRVCAVSRRSVIGGLASIMASPLMAAAPGFRFSSIDGGYLDLETWRGRPILVVNTASRCGFTYQYDGLQALYDRYRDQGLIVMAVPSNDFRQELATEAEVAEFCALNYDLDLPMTEITRITGPDAHPFYQWLATGHGFVPRWNFNKVLLGPDGQMIRAWGASTKPDARPIQRAIEALLDA